MKAQQQLGNAFTAPDKGVSTITDQYDELTYTPGTRVQLGGEGLVSTFADYRKFCEMLLAGGRFAGRALISESAFKRMTTTVTPPQISAGYNTGFGYAYSLFNLEEPLLDGTGSPKGIFGWSGYHNTHFWIDQTNGIYGLFMTRTTPSAMEIQKQFRAAVYRALP
jgi:CubicO group peptidase (beta-lactamase class C family)